MRSEMKSLAIMQRPCRGATLFLAISCFLQFTCGSVAQQVANQSAPEGNELEDTDNDLYYPVMDDDNEISQSPPNVSSKKSSQDKLHSARALVKAMKQVFLDAGYTVQEMHRILSNSSLFTDDDLVGRGESEEIKPQDDQYSLSAYKENVGKILKNKKGNPDQINLELAQLMRDFPENRTLLIAMIQAAVEQWGQNHTRLPPPFGQADKNERITFPPELKYELFNLSRLLTKDLRDQLIGILAIDQTKDRKQVEAEMATIEETERGVVLSSQSVNKTKRGTDEVTISDDAGQVIPTRRREVGNEVEFTIDEDIQLDDVEQEPEKSSFVEGETENPLSAEYLERIIRREQTKQKREEQPSGKLREEIFHSFSRHKRI